ncbi:DEAD/DEAH box helicase [Sulfuracidifex metallicus]|nr:DEAD/DEAH box helicase [Sulfuracidifex metallicus]
MKDLLSLFYEEYSPSSSENYLIVAPTGSGKTHLAKSLLLSRDKIVVYVSPLKALSREVYFDIKDKRKGVFYADSEAYENDLRNFSGEVLLATYEKFDSAIRHRYKWLSEVNMVIIDEIHNVEGDRGIPIESIVAWAKSNSVSTVSLSATLPNLKEYSSWLKAKVIEVKKRAVPLHECVAYPYVLRCFDNGFDAELDVPNLNNSKLGVLIGVLSYVTGVLNKNCLVFVKSRASTEQLKSTLLKFGIKAEAYHSGLKFDVKKKVMDDFKEGKVNV